MKGVALKKKGMNVTHNLAVIPAEFQALWEKRKTFEISKSNLGYRVGSTLIIQEYNAVNKRYSGRVIRTTITHIHDLAGVSNGQDTVLVALSLRVISRGNYPIR